MYPVRSLAGAAALLLASTKSAEAQDKPVPGWGLIGGGVASADIACAGGGCTSGWKHHGPTLQVSVGLMLTPHWGVGVGLDQWWRSPSDTESTNAVTLLVHHYPSIRADFFLEAGAGLSRASVQLAGDTIAAGNGLALMASVGYDLKLLTVHGADITLTPRVSYMSSSIGSLKYNNGNGVFATGWRHQILSFGIAAGLLGSRSQH